jgi:thioredoxin-related protein
MKSKLILYLFILISSSSVAQLQTPVTTTTNEGGLVNWLTFKEAQEKNKITPKPFLIDVYTDWCGWCKHMMKTTYSSPGLAQYVNTNFYPIKFNAEGKDTIEYNGQTYKPTSELPRTPHELALKFLSNKLSYPSTIFVGNNFEFNLLTQGYLEEKKLEPILVFMVENAYKNCPYEDFEDRFNKTFIDTTTFTKKEVKTYSINEALALQKKAPKKIMVNIYANFCNTCIVMNKTTFADTLLADYINKNYYLVNFDAESNDTIVFNNEKFFKQMVNGFPLNTFAFKVTNGRFSFPAIAILDEKATTIDVLNSYYHPKHLKPVLIYFAEDKYKTQKWMDFYQQYQMK